MARVSRSKELLNFEITFYEQLLQDHPDFTDALMALGEAYTRRGWLEKGLAVDQKLIQLKDEDPIVWYNFASSLTLLNRFDEALEALRRAIEFGFDDFTHLANDPDLRALRQWQPFRRFLETLSVPKSR